MLVIRNPNINGQNAVQDIETKIVDRTVNNQQIYACTLSPSVMHDV